MQERVQLAGETSSMTDISGLSQNLLEEKNQEIDHLSEQLIRVRTEFQELRAEKGVENMVSFRFGESTVDSPQEFIILGKCNRMFLVLVCWKKKT